MNTLLTTTYSIAPKHQAGKPITLNFVIKNVSEGTAHVLKWNTLLEGVRNKCFQIEHDGTETAYKGVFVNRSNPDLADYLTLAAGASVEASVELDDYYMLKDSGVYKLTPMFDICDYIVGCEREALAPRSIAQQKPYQLEKSPLVFEIVGNKTTSSTDVTVVNKCIENVSSFDGDYGPRPAGEPQFLNVEWSLLKKKKIVEAHYGACVYVWGCLQSIRTMDTNEYARQNFTRWFGAAGDVDQVKTILEQVYTALVQGNVVYDLTKPDCKACENAYALCVKGEGPIVICTSFLDLPFCGIDSMVGIIIHELTHRFGCTEDYRYGTVKCLKFAKEDPVLAVWNASSYQYFAEQTLPMSYKFDTAATDGEGKTYITLGSLLISCEFNLDNTTFTVDDGYPVSIAEDWGELPVSFQANLDSMGYFEIAERAPVFKLTKSNEFVEFEGNVVTEPELITDEWVDLPANFQEGFDSLCKLKSLPECYITKGNAFALCDNNTFRNEEVIENKWQKAPEVFRTGFDSMTCLVEFQLLVTKEDQYALFPFALALDDADTGSLFSIMGPPPANREEDGS